MLIYKEFENKHSFKFYKYNFSNNLENYIPQ